MESSWNVTALSPLPKLVNPILIEGMPGIGNVAKIAADFLAQELHAKPLFDFFSYSFPSSVFVNENSLIELPTITLYCKSFNDKKQRDILLLVGDLQPTDEQSSYTFCEVVLDVIQKLNCKEIITLGGIGLQKMPKKPAVYCSGNDGESISQYKREMDIKTNLYGVVGPIMGVSGVLLGMAGKRKIPAVCLLAETYAHPMYLGVKSAQQLVSLLAKKFNLGVKVEKLNREIKEIEEELLKRTDDMQKVASSKIAGGSKELEYIG